ncbi:MAG: hypothetical protein ACYC0C_16915 [Devosia sp.]
MAKRPDELATWYRIQVDDWSIEYGLGAAVFADSKQRYDETIKLNLYGTFQRPAALAGQKVTARIFVFEFDINQPKDDRRNEAGELTQDRETRAFDLPVTMRLVALAPVAAALAAGKITTMRCLGTKLRYRHAWISNYWLEPTRADDGYEE